MLEIRNLEKALGISRFSSVGLTAQQGYILGLVGKNGAGKATGTQYLALLDYSGEIRHKVVKTITQESWEVGYLPERAQSYAETYDFFW